MKVFMIGATGYIGSVVAERLQQAGHQVAGLARSDAAHTTLQARGITAQRGDLSDLDSLARGAQQADAVILVAQPRFNPQDDFVAQMQQMNELMGNAVDLLVDTLAGSGKTLLITGGTGAYGDTGDQIVNEDTPVAAVPMMQRFQENDRKVLGSQGLRGLSIRPGIVYGRGGGPVTMLSGMAQHTGRLQLIGSGNNALSLVHVDDLADLYLLMLERAAGGTLLNAVAEPFVTQKDLLQAVSTAIGLGGVVEPMPAEQSQSMSYGNGGIFARNMRVSAARARQLGWQPYRPSVIDELLHGSYRQPASLYS
jgi:nucleoside-diphosphate-sugar epimerase